MTPSLDPAIVASLAPIPRHHHPCLSSPSLCSITKYVGSTALKPFNHYKATMPELLGHHVNATSSLWIRELKRSLRSKKSEPPDMNDDDFEAICWTRGWHQPWSTVMRGTPTQPPKTKGVSKGIRQQGHLKNPGTSRVSRKGRTRTPCLALSL